MQWWRGWGRLYLLCDIFFNCVVCGAGTLEGALILLNFIKFYGICEKRCLVDSGIDNR